MEVLKYSVGYSRYNVHGLIHEWDSFLLLKIELRPIMKALVNVIGLFS